MTFIKNNAQITYIVKILGGLILIGSAVLITLITLPIQLPQWLMQILSIGIFISICPGSYLIYSKMDELEKKLHNHACIATLTILIPAMGVIGVLQASNIIPLFNQVWVLVIGIIIWGISLVFSDRFYK